MYNKTKKTIILLLVFLLTFSNVPLTISANENEQSQEGYEIYPLPQELDYTGGEFVIREQVNVVFDGTIDEPTRNRLTETLDNKGLTVTESNQKVDGTTNILVGTEGSEQYVDDYFNEHLTYNADFFDQIDPYILSVDQQTIAILGKDTDAAFYGVTSLMHILDQIEGRTIRQLRIDDYSSTSQRGFIEGYYGIPWSNQDRMSLMEFGGQFKMTSYVYAPKDSPYHNSQWRQPYPEEELEAIEEMVQVGIDSKVRFVWTIHPFMHSRITFDNYDASLEAMVNKFDQLYDAGVRQYGVLGDDAGHVDPALYSQIMQDLEDWAQEKGDVYDFLTVPQGYNTAWTNWTELDGLDAGLPENHHIMWTGDNVTGHVTQQTLDNFKLRNLPDGASPRRDPVFWLNWPVNDINMSRLMMGKGEVLNPGVEGLGGVITNPMQDAEASKVAIFAVADYGWNLNDFDADQSWADSFKYIDPDASDAFHTLAKHMSDPAPNGHGLVLGESEELKPLLEAFSAALNNGEAIGELGQELISELEKIVEASDEFMALTQNEKLKAEVGPYAGSIKDLSNSMIGFIKAAIAFEENEQDALWSHYSQASADYGASKQHSRPLINGLGTAIPGSKRLIPVAEMLDDYLSPIVSQLFGEGDEFVMTPISSYTNDEIWAGSLGDLVDGDESTRVWFGKFISQGDYVGVELNQPITIKGLEILQGNDETDKDAFYYGKFQYYDDQTDEWVDTTGQSYGEYTNVVKEQHLDITTTKVRFIVDPDQPIAEEGENPKWAAFREFRILTEHESDLDPDSIKPELIRTDEWRFYGGTNNVSVLLDDDENTFMHFDPRDGQDDEGNDVNDQVFVGDYLGLDLGQEIPLGKVEVQFGTAGNANERFDEFDLEYSRDGETYTTLNSYQNTSEVNEDFSNDRIFARYVRVRNTKLISRWPAFRTFKVEPVRDGLDAYTNVSDLSLKMHLGESNFELDAANNLSLAPGDYVGLELSRIHDLETITLDRSEAGENLELQVSKNEIEWTTVTDVENVPNARYIRLINTTNEAIEFDLNVFSVSSFELQPMYLADHTFGPFHGSSTTNGELDGDLTTYAYFQQVQKAGQYAIYDIGQEIDLDELEIYVHDSVHDFIYDGIVSISTDKENWEPIIEIGDQEPNDSNDAEITDSFPNHKISYNTVSAENINQRAQYIKIEITQDVNRWIQINEIMINGGEYRPVENDARFDASVIEQRGGQPSHLADGNLSTQYIPSEANGTLTYHISDRSNANSVTILQNAGTNSDAEVKARIAPINTPEDSEVVTLGRLNRSLNQFNIPSGYYIFDLQIEWAEVIPQLYEVILSNEMVEEVNKDSLEAAINTEVNQENWTASSKAVYADAYAIAEATLAGEYYSQIAIDSATADLERAISGADVLGDQNVLQVAVDEAKALEQSLYTQASYRALDNAIRLAEAALADTADLSEDNVATQLAELDRATENLKYEVISKENAMLALEDALAFLDGVTNPEQVYTAESYNNFVDAIETIENLLAADITTPINPTEFVAATEALNEAWEGLVEGDDEGEEPTPPTVDMTDLAELVAEVETYDASDYTEETFDVFMAALTEANDVLENETATQDEVDTALQNLTDAIDGLEEVIHLVGTDVPTHVAPLDRTSWEIFVNSEETEGEDGGIVNLIDGNPNTIWHSEWSGANPNQAWPYDIEIDLGEEQTFNGFSYLPRQDESGLGYTNYNGRAGLFEIYVGTALDNAELVMVAEFDWQDDLDNDVVDSTEKYVAFDQEVTGSYVMFRIVDSQADTPGEFGSGAEFNLFEVTESEEPAPVDKDELTTEIATANEYDQADYTVESYDVLVAALTEAETVLADEDATQEAVNAATTALRVAIDGLVEVEDPTDPTDPEDPEDPTDPTDPEDPEDPTDPEDPEDPTDPEDPEDPTDPEDVDVADLEAKVAEAQAIDTVGKTEASVTALTEAIEAAEAVLADEDATQDAVDAALLALTEAIEGLVEVDSPVDPADPTDGDELPSTATGVYNWLAVGLAILLMGGFLVIRSRKRAN